MLLSCRHYTPAVAVATDTTAIAAPVDTLPPQVQQPLKTSGLGDSIVAFAKTLLGKPYVYGCMAPSTGFDCSGFINYVYHHFNIPVPRSSVDFTNYGKEIPLEKARAGDLILFTGTNASVRTVGHIGIIISDEGSDTQFIHASSGKEMAVIITPLNDRYKARFVKVIRVIE